MMLRGTLALEPEARGRLEHLFKACDTRGQGSIGRDELRDLCSSLGLAATESDALFQDLDCDGDGKIDFNDFVAGFREFVCPPPPSSGATATAPTACEPLNENERRRKEAANAWTDFLDQLHHSANHVVNKDRIMELEKALRSTSSSPQLISCFEQVFKGLIKDVQRLQEENSQLENTFKKERESHEHHLHQLEEEMDSQVKQLEKQIKQQARDEAEAERKALKSQMDAELSELQTHLKLFQSFDNWLKKDRADDTERVRRMQGKLEDASHENRQLRISLADTQTNMALLRSEMAQMRSQYEEKCKELHLEKEVVLEYLHEHDHLTRQLNLLHEANKRLQDMNDSLRTSQDSATLVQKIHSYRRASASLQRGSVIGDYLLPEKNDQAVVQLNDEPVFITRNKVSPGNHSPYLERESGKSHDSDEFTYGITRLMEDLDSGLSTMRDITESEENESLTEDDVKAKTPDGQHQAVTTNRSSVLVSTASEKLPGIGRSATPSLEKQPIVTPSCRCSNQFASLSGTDTSWSSIMTLPEPIGPPERTYKVVFAGDANVGKSTFILRIVKGAFIPTISSTLGVDFHVKTLRVDNINVTLQLWDTAGQERFRSITKSYFRRADGVMLLYDCTSEKSFLNVRHWMESIDEVLEKNLPIMLCSNKMDLRESKFSQGKCCVDKEAGERLARDFAAIFVETSAKDGFNVLDAIVQLTRQMAANEDLEVRTSAIEVGKTPSKKKNCCKSS